MSKIEFMSLAEKIADGIKSGIYQDTLPSIARLSEKFDVCPATVKRVLSQLRDWDLVDGERGKCVRINPKASGNPFFHRNVVILADLPTLSCPFYAQVLNRLNESFGSVYLCFHLFVSPEQFRECGFQPDCVIVINYYSDSDMETLKRYYPSGNIIMRTGVTIMSRRTGEWQVMRRLLTLRRSADTLISACLRRRRTTLTAVSVSATKAQGNML